MNIEIIEYTPAYAQHFRKLNEEWLQKYFVVEAYDEALFAHPEKIIDNGGKIFFAKNEKNEIIATASLMKEVDGLELAKMSVTEAYKGKGIGNLLMQHCIQAAKNMHADKIFLISNRGLLPALNMYKKFGFTEVPLHANNPYARGDIKMELIL